MRKLIATGVVVLVAALGAFTAAAQANSSSGFVYYNGTSTPYVGASVSIHNLTTGAWGSTSSDGSGIYNIGGLVDGYQYELVGSGCKVHQFYGSLGYQFTATPFQLPTIYMVASGSC